MAITFFNESVSFKLPNKLIIRNIIKTIAKDNQFKCGDINYIFCNDDYLLQINQKYLNHDYFTDIVTFNYNNLGSICGDMFISIDRVKENSELYKQKLDIEFVRVIFHGILHLVGFTDDTNEKKKIMRDKEDFYIHLFLNYVK